MSTLPASAERAAHIADCLTKAFDAMAVVRESIDSASILAALDYEHNDVKIRQIEGTVELTFTAIIEEMGQWRRYAAARTRTERGSADT